MKKHYACVLDWFVLTRSLYSLQEENTKLKSELTELKGNVSEITSLVHTLQSKFANRDKPVLNHTHLSMLEQLAKADDDKASTIVHLKKDLTNLQKVVEGIKVQAELGLMMVHQDGPSPLGVMDRDSGSRIRGGGRGG